MEVENRKGDEDGMEVEGLDVDFDIDVDENDISFKVKVIGVLK